MFNTNNFLLIMRHAKSDRGDPLLNDFDRPLTGEGSLEPSIIARKLNELPIKLEKALVSPAKRTKETWDFLAAHLNHPPRPVFLPSLYEASLEDFLTAISLHAENTTTLLVIAHCPAVAEATEFLVGEYHDFKPADLALLHSSQDNLLDSLSKPKSFVFKKMLSAK